MTMDLFDPDGSEWARDLKRQIEQDAYAKRQVLAYLKMNPEDQARVEGELRLAELLLWRGWGVKS